MTAKPLRSATVEFERTYLATPLDWTLRLTGQSIGGYGVLQDSFGGRYASKDRAEAVAAIWIETGLTPAFQNAENIAAARAVGSPIRIEEAA